jgi:hypothetical protein
MTSIVPYISARIMSAQVPRGFSGKGYIEKAGADGTYVIALSTGKIVAQCAPGSLAEGEAVLVKVSGSDLIIEKTSGQFAFPQIRIVPDALDLNEQPATKSTQDTQPGTTASVGPAVASSIAAVAVNGPGIPAEGFYYFETVEKALSWLSKFSPGHSDDVRRMVPDNFTRVPIVMQIIATETDGMKALMLPVEAADARMAYFVRDRLQSDVWDAFFPGGLLPLLREKGMLLSERLVAIDAFLQGYGNAVAPGTVAGNSPAPDIALPMGKNGVNNLFNQWLNIALDESSPIFVFARQDPLPSAAGLPPLVEKIQRTSTMPDASSIMPQIGDFSLNTLTADDPQSRAAVIPRILERLGIAFERSILESSVSGAGPEATEPNLKKFLLTLDRDLNSIIGQKAENPLRALYDASRDIAETWATGSGLVLRELSFSPVSRPSGAPAAQIADDALILRSVNDWSQKITALLKNIVSEVSRTSETLSIALAQHKASQEQHLPASPVPNMEKGRVAGQKDESLDGFVQSAVSRIKTVLGEIAGKIGTVLTNLAAQRADLLKPPQPYPGTAAQTREILASPYERLRAQASAAVSEITGPALRQICELSDLVDRIVSQSTKMIEDATGRATDGAGAVQHETTRRLVESALQRIESLQVSAKPIASGDIRQQVVMIPMNIDGQWNDVIVKFVRDGDQKKKGGLRKQFAVSINVAPAFLGDINVSMDYKGADLSVKMDFDSDRTLAWFENNRKGLVDAFVKLGFKNPRMSMQKSVSPPKQSDTGTRQTSPTAIDIMV